MKNLKYILIICTLVLIFGCEDTDVLPPDFQDATWVSSIRPGADYVIGVGGSITFRDLSQGALSHEFIIEEGNKFLHAYGDNDSLALFINKDLNLINTDKDGHVLFLNQGINTVKLRNTFKDSVAYQGAVVIPAFQENGVWVIENTWTIDVYGEIKPAFKVLDKNGIELINITGDDLVSLEDVSSWPVIDVEAGDALTYIDLTTEDRPNERLWKLKKAKPETSTDSIVNAGYFSLGTFNAGSFTSSRVGDLPNAKTLKGIPLIIHVIPSSQPFEYNVVGGMIESPDEVITFGVTGEIVPFSGEEGSFTVNVKNSDTGFDQDIPVISAKINADDATKIDLKLQAPIYNSDVVNVSYSGGSITSVDTRPLRDFGPINVEMDEGVNLFDPSLATYMSFEDASGNRWGAYLFGFWVGRPTNAHDGDRNATENFYYLRGTVVEGYPVSDGDASVRYISPVTGITDNKALQFGNFSTLDIPAGRYKLRMDVFMSEGNTMDNITIDFKGPGVQYDWDVSPANVTRGEFFTVEQTLDFSSPPTDNRFDLQVNTANNPNAQSSVQEFYFDNFVLLGIEARP